MEEAFQHPFSFLGLMMQLFTSRDTFSYNFFGFFFLFELFWENEIVIGQRNAGDKEDWVAWSKGIVLERPQA